MIAPIIWSDDFFSKRPRCGLFIPIRLLQTYFRKYFVLNLALLKSIKFIPKDYVVKIGEIMKHILKFLHRKFYNGFYSTAKEMVI